MEEAALNGWPIFLGLCLLLHLTVPGRVLVASTEDEAWTCICEPGGFLGTQNFSNVVGFTDCNCPSGCPVCPAGQVLHYMSEINSNCSCINPLLVIIRLLKLQLASYTIQMEKSFIRNFASLLQVSAEQVIPVSRRNGSVILDVYIFSALGVSEKRTQLETVTATLLQRNSSSGGILEDSDLGPFTIINIEDFSREDTFRSASKKDIERNVLPQVLILSLTIVVVALLTSFLCLIYQRWKCQSSIFWFGKDSSTFTALINQQSALTEDYQVYENECFSGSTGCIGRRSLKSAVAVGPFLGLAIRHFSYADLYETTDGFSKANIIGFGGSSSVYRGKLRDGRAVAIKKLVTQTGADLDREFLLEIELLSRLHHFHLVPLLGYCMELHGKNVERLLVYEYMPNGNLRDHLNKRLGKESLNWLARVKIALGAARGLEYLHEAADPRVLHRDFKSSNILLDSKWRAKVSDFGMATTFRNYDYGACPGSPVQMLGTFGYFAPEYAMMGRATLKSDVFSFGVVILELITGREPIDKSLPRGQESLIAWALPLLQDKRWFIELIDPVLKDSFSIEDMERMTQLAWACLQKDPDLRPRMTSVVQVLATMVPENKQKVNSFATLSNIYEVPRFLFWTQDYDFSRDECSGNMIRDGRNALSSASFIDNNKAVPCKLNDAKSVVEIEEELATKALGTNIPGKSTSWSASEYLQKLTSMTANDPIRRSSEEEALDLVKPRLESFWQNNSLVAQVNSPSR